MKKFLLLQTAFIGDVILATPLIEKLHRFFPGAKIDFLLRKGNEALFKGHPLLNEILIWEKQHQKNRRLWELTGQVRANHYDVVVNLQRFLSSGLVTGFSNAGQRIGFDKNPLSFAFTHKFPHVIGTIDKPVHEVERNLSLIEHLTDKSFQKPRLYPSAADVEGVRENGPYVCLAPTSVWFTKQWPADNWVDLVNRIPVSKKVMLLGAPADREACENIKARSNHPYVINRAGGLSLLQSAALMQGAEMNYVNDSAPLHLCSAMNAPVTAIFCSTVPRFGFGPLSDRSIIAETQVNLDCRPCGLHGFKACPKGHFRCAEMEVRVG